MLPDELSEAINTEANGKYLYNQQFILEDVREKLSKLNGRNSQMTMEKMCEIDFDQCFP